MTPDFLKIAVAAAALSDDPRQAPRLARQLGFAGLQFDAYAPALRIPDLSGSGRREFRHLLSAQDQQLAGLRFDVGPKGLGPGADVDQALARLDRVLESAAGLASPLVCVDLGPLPEPARPAKPKSAVSPQQAGLILIPTPAANPEPESPATPPPDPAFVSQVDAALVELGRMADRYTVTVALRSELASFASLERALAASACPWFGIDLDPASALRDEWDLDEIFSRLGARIRHIRGRDAIKGADRRTKPTVIGQGSVEWPALLGNLDSSGYRGWITVDPIDLPNRLAAAREGREKLTAV